MVHTVITRTDVWLGERDGESVWETTASMIHKNDDVAVSRLLEAHGVEREDVRVQQIVCPDGEGQMTVIEIHYAEEVEECDPEQHEWGETADNIGVCLVCGFYA